MFSEELITKIKADVLQRFPTEACGLIVAGEYIPVDNVAPEPTKDFKIPLSILIPYQKAGTLEAIVHSHPFEHVEEKSCPSKADMQGQVDTAVTWGILDTDGKMVADPYWWGDFLLEEPLIGAEFHHGVRDCYHAIRKWYWQRRNKTLLPEFPRDNRWWMEKETAEKKIEADDLYLNGFEKAGFFKIAREQLQDGDVVLGKVNCETRINHGGVYLDNKEDGHCMIYHHLPGRLSRREPAMTWVRRADIFLRYNAS